MSLSKKPKKIYGMGNPLLDISVNVTEDVLTKYGLKPANAILAEEKHLPLYKELSERTDVSYIPGGATLNSIRVAKWMLQEDGDCTYVGCIGKDKFGEIMKQKTAEEGLNVPFMYTDKQPTGTCGVLVTGKDRSLVANLAAANCFTEPHIHTPEVKKAIEAAEIYYIAGFFLTVSFESVFYVAKHACENNKIFCMNLSAPFIIQFFGKQLDEIMPYVDILFSNDDEAKEYGKNKKIPSTPLSNANSYDSLSSEDAGSFRVDSKNYVHDVVSYLVNLPKVNKKRGRIVVITQGPHPTVVGTLEAGVSDYICPKIPVWSIVDTNGAGYAFVGGFISQLALGETISECVAAGQYAASVIIRHSGCTFPPKPDSPPYSTHLPSNESHATTAGDGVTKANLILPATSSTSTKTVLTGASTKRKEVEVSSSSGSGETSPKRPKQ